MLVETIKKRMMQALKAGKTGEKEILGVALGEMQTAEARGEAMGDAEAQAVVRRLIKSNDETLKVATDEAQKKALGEENAILASLLPQTLSVDQIVEKLAPVRDAIKASPNDGAATGVAMKHLKAQGAEVTGKDVQAAVKQVRA